MIKKNGNANSLPGRKWILTFKNNHKNWMFITLMFDVHITRFYVIKVRASTVVLRCLVVFKNFTVFGNFSRRWISCADSKGSESRNIYDLNFRITILYRSHRAIKIWEIFICFRLLHKKSENLMISYVLNKKFPFNFRFPYIDPHVGCSWMESHHECLDVHKLTWRVLN